MYSLGTNVLINSGILIYKNITSCKRNALPLLSFYVQTRNTFILKRRYPVKLYKKGFEDPKLKGSDFVYDLVEDTECRKKPDVQLILKKYVEGIGERGDLVTIKRNIAYNQLLIPGLADFATPEAIEKANNDKKLKGSYEKTYSSLTAAQTIRFLESRPFSIIMNKDTKWTLQPWHIRVNFRKARLHVPEHCISIPSKPISGADVELEGKEFCVTITINNRERAKVRCRIHHWSTILSEKLPYEEKFWLKEREAIFPEEEKILHQLRMNSKNFLKSADPVL